MDPSLEYGISQIGVTSSGISASFPTPLPRSRYEACLLSRNSQLPSINLSFIDLYAMIRDTIPFCFIRGERCGLLGCDERFVVLLTA